MLIGISAGVALGFMAPASGPALGVVSNVFLALIKSAVAPLLFGLLVSAVARLGSLGELGRIGLTAVIYFEVVTALALVFGAAAMIWAQPGRGVALEASRPAGAATPAVGDIIAGAFPASVFEAMRAGEVLPLVLFCLLFGAAVNTTLPRSAPVLAFAESVAQATFHYTKFVMYLAPLAVCGALASTIASRGWSVLEGLLRFALTAWAAQAAFSAVVLGGALLAARVPAGRFLRHCREPVLIAFATTSSAAAMPTMLAAMRAYGVKETVLGVVAPLGLSFNLAGSTLHLAMAAYFAAQAAGIDLSPGQQAMILLTLKLTSKGVAGIPRANFVVLSGLFTMFGLPVEALPMLLAIDPVIDMIRTAVNVFGHCVAPVVLEKRVKMEA